MLFIVQFWCTGYYNDLLTDIHSSLLVSLLIFCSFFPLRVPFTIYSDLHLSSGLLPPRLLLHCILPCLRYPCDPQQLPWHCPLNFSVLIWRHYACYCYHPHLPIPPTFIHPSCLQTFQDATDLSMKTKRQKIPWLFRGNASSSNQGKRRISRTLPKGITFLSGLCGTKWKDAIQSLLGGRPL